MDVLARAAENAGGGGAQSKQHYKTVTEVLKTRLLDVTKEFKEILTLRTEVSIHLKKKTEYIYANSSSLLFLNYYYSFASFSFSSFSSSFTLFVI